MIRSIASVITSRLRGGKKASSVEFFIELSEELLGAGDDGADCVGEHTSDDWSNLTPEIERPSDCLRRCSWALGELVIIRDFKALAGGTDKDVRGLERAFLADRNSVLHVL